MRFPVFRTSKTLLDENEKTSENLIIGSRVFRFLNEFIARYFFLSLSLVVIAAVVIFGGCSFLVHVTFAYRTTQNSTEI